VSDSHDHGKHDHRHGVVDPSIAASTRGVWALKLSFAILSATAVLQFVVVVVSGSVALLADTIHNAADAATAIPLGIAFWLGRRRATRRFTYGLGRAEDFAGLVIVAIILGSMVVAVYESVDRLLHPRPVDALWAVAGASLVGFFGNEAVAIFRIRVGREIGSAALIADGHHARIDGWTSAAVLLGAVGIWLGYPLADPLVGLLICIAIVGVVWQSGRSIGVRMLDGVETSVVDEIAHAARHVPGVADVTDVRARWIGHGLHVEVNIAVPGTLSVAGGHEVAKEVRHQLFHHVPHLGGVLVHVDPLTESGEQHHRIGTHAHDELPAHSHDGPDDGRFDRRPASWNAKKSD